MTTKQRDFFKNCNKSDAKIRFRSQGNPKQMEEVKRSIEEYKKLQKIANIARSKLVKTA